MLLLGLIGIVGLLLLAYSFELSLVFLVVLGASLLTRVSLRKLLLALQRSKQESGVVSTFWISATFFLITVLSWSAFLYFVREDVLAVLSWSTFLYFKRGLLRFTALESLVLTALLVAVISFLVGLFILMFLRSKTGFPRWTVAPAVLLGLAGLMPIVWSMSKVRSPFPIPAAAVPREIRPGEVFDVSYHTKITFRGRDVRVQEEYKIQPTSDYVFVSIDDEWLSRNPSVSIGPLRWFEAKKSTGALPGLFVTVDQESVAHITELGLLRRKLEIHSWELRVCVKNLPKTPPPEEEADSKAQISTFSLKELSTASGKVEVRLPKNSYLGSFPEGKLLKLPDRDQVVLNVSDFSSDQWQRLELELYYLA